MDNLMMASLEDLTSIPDIGPIIARNIVQYFQNKENIEMIERLRQYGINMEYLNTSNIQEDSNFMGKTFVLTGTLNQITRNKASKLIEDRGGKTTSSVTKKTDVVVVGDNPGSKYDKAITLGITIWNEDKFMELVSK